MSKHTPTPWSVDKRFKTLVIGDGHSVATCGGYQNNTIDPDELAEMLEANARHIVKCVNNFDEMARLLSSILPDLLSSEIDGHLQRYDEVSELLVKLEKDQ